MGVAALQGTPLTRLDREVARAARAHASPVGDRALEFVTHLGSTLLGALAVLAVVVWGWRRRPRGLLAAAVVAAVGSYLTTTAVKAVVQRPRPELNDAISTLGSSFPSTHSANGAAVWAAVALVVGAGVSPRWRRGLAGAAIVVAVTVAATRVLLGVHWLSDTIAGVAVGWGWVALAMASLAFVVRRRADHR